MTHQCIKEAYLFHSETFRYAMEYDILRRPIWANLVRPRIEKQAGPYPAPVKIAEVSLLALLTCYSVPSFKIDELKGSIIF